MNKAVVQLSELKTRAQALLEQAATLWRRL